MDMTRRSLFAMLAGAALIDPERTGWVKGAKVISIASPHQAWLIMSGRRCHGSIETASIPNTRWHVPFSGLTMRPKAGRFPQRRLGSFRRRGRSWFSNRLGVDNSSKSINSKWPIRSMGVVRRRDACLLALSFAESR